MADLALFARLLPLLLLASPLLRGARARDASGRVVHAFVPEEPLNNEEGAAASVDFITAEASLAEAEAEAAAAWAEAVAAATAAAANTTDFWEVLDVEDVDEGTDDGGAEAVGAQSPPSPTPPPPPAVPHPLDTLFDFALGAVAHELVLNGSAEQPTPDFDKDFHVRVGPFKVHGHLKASGGSAGDLSSLFRDGSVAVRQGAQGALVLEAAAGLRHLRLHYRHYQARAGPVRVSGTLEAEASPASLRAQLELRPPCTALLRWLRVERVGPLRVRASGLGVLRRLLPLITRALDKRLRGDVERMVLQRLSLVVQTQLRRLACEP